MSLTSSTAETKPLEGEGFWRYDDGTVYEGSWKAGNRHGRGVCFFPLSGNVYVGDFNQDVVDGVGSLFYRDGDFFHGEFRDGMCDGRGIFFSNGVEVRGEWRRGKRLNDPTSTNVLDNRETPMSKARRDLHTKTFSALMHALSAHFALYMGNEKIFAEAARHPSVSVAWSDLGTVSAAPTFPPPTTVTIDKEQNVEEGGHRQRRDTSAPDVAAESLSRSRWERTGISAPPSLSIGGTPIAAASAVEEVKTVSLVADQLPPVGGGDPHSPKRLTFVRPPTCDPMLLFSVATPSFTEAFSFRKFLKRTVAVLFPILSLPHFRCSPFKITNNALERELVVSGASVRIRPGVPRATLYMSLIVLVLSTLGVCLDRDEILHESVDTRDVQVVDIIAPYAGWFILSIMCGAYHAYDRVAHPLERMDRLGMPAMASFIASSIDSYSEVCVYTWDANGNVRVSNTHYKYRWITLSTLLSLLLALTSPLIARLFLGKAPYGTTSYEIAAAVILSVALFVASSAMLYMVFKATDIQRQLLSQLSVLTSLAYVNGSSVLRPTTLRNSPFHFDDHDLSVREKHRGVVGWMITRAHVVYANVITNHSARGSLLVPFTLYLLLVSILGIAYWASIIGDAADRCELFTTYQAVGAMALLVHGAPLMRYLLVSATVAAENSRHLYLVDLALILHSPRASEKSSPEQACFELLKSHRGALERHDYHPHLATIPITPAIILVVGLMLLLGFLAFIYPIVISLICFASNNN